MQTVYGDKLHEMSNLFSRNNKDTICMKYQCLLSGKKNKKYIIKFSSAGLAQRLDKYSYYFSITKTCLYNVDPLKPHFYIVKLVFTGVYIIFHISAQNIDCGYSLELPH